LLLVVFYGGLAALWARPDTGAYQRVMQAIGVHTVSADGAYAKSPLPFYDLAGVLSWSDCAHRGVDVLAANPCDPLQRLLNYSPLLRDLPLYHLGGRNLVASGLVLDIAFLLMLVAVLRPKTLAQFAIAALVSVSQAVVFAVERANLDIVIFTLAAATCLWGMRGRLAPCAQYGAALLCGLIKFYPLALFVTALRERTRIFVTIAAVSLLVVTGFAVVYWHDLARIAALLPKDEYSGDMFGAPITRLLMVEGLHLSPQQSAGLMAAIILAFAIATFRLAGALGTLDFSSAKGALLLCGSAFVVGCFFGESNVAYRAIFLLMTLPGLFAIATQKRGRLSSLLFVAVALVIACLWVETVRAHFLLYPGYLQAEDLAPGVLAFFLLREAMWWYVVAVLAAVLICFVRQSPLFKSLAGRFARPSQIELQP